MKRTFNFGFLSVILAVLFIFALPAHATKYEPPKTGGGDTTATGGAAGAVAGAAAGAVGIAGAYAGDSKALATTGDSDAKANVGDINAGDSGHTFVAPAPVTTVVPMSNGGIVTKSHAVGLLFNAVSWSKSEQMTDPFQGGMRLIAEYERLCQFETASMIRQRQYALLDPAYRELPAQPGVRNLTIAECAQARK